MKATSFHNGMHLQEDMLLAPQSTCPFCQGCERERKFLLQEQPEIYLLKCKNCSAVSASRMPKQSVLARYYDSYYKENIKQVTFDKDDKLAFHIYENSKEHIKCRNILDFGGGSGDISIKVAERFLSKEIEKVNITLVDYSNLDVKLPSKNIQVDRISDLSAVKNRFDLVIASAVIEHIPEPMDIMKALLGLLNSGGIFYSRTPYVLPLMSVFNTLGIPFDFTYPGHLHDLGPQFWNEMKYLPADHRFQITCSRPSLVETSFKENFLRTAAAYVFKAPWFLLGNRYHLVGGWEIFLKKNAA